MHCKVFMWIFLQILDFDKTNKVQTIPKVRIPIRNYITEKYTKCIFLYFYVYLKYSYFFIFLFHFIAKINII